MFWLLLARVKVPPVMLMRACCSAAAPRLGVNQVLMATLPERSSITPLPPLTPATPTSDRESVFKAAAALSTKT